MYRLLMRFAKDESGATAIEYGLIAAGLAVAIIPVIKGLGTNLKSTFGAVQTALVPAAYGSVVARAWVVHGVHQVRPSSITRN
jgi:pilus assembly protein Flp/PilA